MTRSRRVFILSLGTAFLAVPSIAQPTDPWFQGEELLPATAVYAATRTLPDQAHPLPEINQGMAAITRAQTNGRYLFFFFFAASDEPTLAQWSVFQSAMNRAAPRADSVAINIRDPNEKAVVDYFAVGRAPMPLALAMAPNGAVMGGFPITFTEAQLLQSFGTPAMEQALRALQTQKLVLLCVQNQRTQSNQAALHGVNGIKSDPQFSTATEIVFVDPADPREAGFIAQLQVDPAVTVAQTVLIAPPGTVLGKFMAGTTKTMILSKLQASGACGPGGCCPGGKCGPTAETSTPSASSRTAPKKKGIIAKVKSMFGN